MFTTAIILLLAIAPLDAGNQIAPQQDSSNIFAITQGSLLISHLIVQGKSQELKNLLQQVPPTEPHHKLAVAIVTNNAQQVKELIDIPEASLAINNTAVLLNIGSCRMRSVPLFHVACYLGYEDTVKLLLEAKKVNINQHNTFRNTALHETIIGSINGKESTERHNIIQLLYANNIEINQQNKEGNTALHMALMTKVPLALTQQIVALHANKTIKNNDGDMPYATAQAIFSDGFAHFFGKRETLLREKTVEELEGIQTELREAYLKIDLTKPQ